MKCFKCLANNAHTQTELRKMSIAIPPTVGCEHEMTCKYALTNERAIKNHFFFSINKILAFFVCARICWIPRKKEKTKQTNAQHDDVLGLELICFNAFSLFNMLWLARKIYISWTVNSSWQHTHKKEQTTLQCCAFFPLSFATFSACCRF